MGLPSSDAKHLFFTGKGGVGKTTVACALATEFADAGQRVLLISTDPASNIGQVFGREIGPSITSLSDLVQGTKFDAIEIDPDAEAEDYREAILGPVRGLLPAEILAATEETLSGSCTVEVASFNRFTQFLTDGDIQDSYDRIIFDTAPTGHTLRLLSLPGDWSSFIQKGAGDASCLGPLSGLEKNRQTYQSAVDALSDPSLTDVVLVARAQQSTLSEAARTAFELSDLDIASTALVINGILPRDAATDDLSTAIHQREQNLLRKLDSGDLPELAGIPVSTIELSANPIMGVEGLRSLAKPERSAGSSGQEALLSPEDTAAMEPSRAVPVGLSGLVDDLAEGSPKLVLCMGKGGVGKTTVAQAIATRLAQMGKPVHLSTTDPANHLDRALTDQIEGLTVSSIDPEQVTQDYREEVIDSKGASLDAEGLAQLIEDLRSPCTEEVAVFRAFSDLVAQADDRWVILDTAPTGHTLLLLDATGSYHRELMRQSGQDCTSTTLQRLQDSDVTRPILVTLPETTPILEAQALSSDLERAEITPWAWVINQSLPASQTSSSFLERRARAQLQEIDAVTRSTTAPTVQLPFLAAEPVSVEQLAELD